MAVPTAMRVAITLAFIAIVIVLSVTPGRSEPGESVFVWLVATTPTPLQKLLHLVIYAMLAMLWAWTLEGIESRGLRIFLAFVLTAGLGASLEWYQTKVPGRFGSLFDVLLNAAGAIAGLAAAVLLL